jgi:predicted HicB family RNase H-like nuclease
MKKPSPEPELKSAPLHAKVRPSVKAMAETMAADDRRSLAQWLEIMIEEEAARRAGKKAG